MKKAKIKKHLSKILSLTLVTCLLLTLIVAADVFYPDMAYAAETDAIGTNNYTTGVTGGATLTAGTTYNFGGYSWVAAEVNSNYAVLQSTGVTSGAWPGYVMTGPTSPSSGSWGNANTAYAGNIDGLNISGYNSTMSTLYNNIKAAEYTSASYGKGLFLVSNSKAGQTTSGQQGSGNYWSALKTAAGRYSSLGATYASAWLGTVSGSVSAWYVNSNGNVYGNYNYSQSFSFVVAPAFNLDLSKVRKDSSNNLTIATFSPSTGINATQSITSVTEGETVDLRSVITGVTYSNGDNQGKTASYKIAVDSGTVSGTNWTAPTGINKPTTITLRIIEQGSGSNLSTTKTITVNPREAGSVGVEKLSSFPEYIVAGESVDLSSYIDVTAFDSGNQSDGTISGYTLSLDGDYGTIDGTTYTPSGISSTRTITIKVTPTEFPVLNSSTSTVDYSGIYGTFTIVVKPSTTGWTERDEATDSQGFHTYYDLDTEITWKYRYNDNGLIRYLYTEDDVSSIISDGHVLLVPSSVNGVSVVGIGGGSKDGEVIPFVPTTGSDANDTWTSIYLPSSVKYIADGAFYQNPASADIVIPGTVQRIGVNAFKESAITSVTLNDANNLNVGSYAFADIPTLTSVKIRGNGTTLNLHAFQNDTGLTQIEIPNGTRFKGETDQNDSYAFGGTTNLELVKIDTDTVYSNIFGDNPNLEKVIFGNNVSSVKYDWSGTATTNADTLDDTKNRTTYVLNSDTEFQMDKTTGGSPFGYAKNLTVIGKDRESSGATYNSSGDPVVAMVKHLAENYTNIPEEKAYAQGTANNITISVVADPSQEDGVTSTITTVQDGIESYYSGSIFSGHNLDKNKTTVYKMFGEIQNGTYETAEFYVLRTNDADTLLAKNNSSELDNTTGLYHTTYTNDVISSFEAKDIVTINTADVDAGTVDVKTIVLKKDANGDIITDSTGHVQAFTYTMAVPVMEYTAEEDFLQNYGSYRAVITKINSLQSEVDRLTSEVNSLNSQLTDKNAQITSLTAQVNELTEQNTELEAELNQLRYEASALRTDKANLQAQVTSLQNELSDTIDKYAELLNTTAVNKDDYTYVAPDEQTGEDVHYVLVNGEEAPYDDESGTEVSLPNGDTVTVYTGTDSHGNEFTFYVADDGVHVVFVENGTVVMDQVSSDTVSAMQHKIAAELAGIRNELEELKGVLNNIATILNSIGSLDNTDSDYSIDTTGSESEQYQQIETVIQQLVDDIQSLDAALTTSNNNLVSAQQNNVKFYDALVMTYNTLSGEELDVSQVSNTDELINSVAEVVESTATLLANVEGQNAIYEYQIEDRNLALSDIRVVINGGEPTGVNNKITQLTTLIQNPTTSDSDRALYTAQVAELNTYKSLIASVNNNTLSQAERDALDSQITTLQTKVNNLESENASQKTRITSLTTELESAKTLSSQYKMIVDTANTLLGLNLKNTDSKEQVEAAIKQYIQTSVKTDTTTVDTSSASYNAGYTAGRNSVDTSSYYNNGYSVGYAQGVQAGSSSGNDASAATIANLTSQVTALSNEKAALQSEKDGLSSWVSALASANESLTNEKQTLESRNNSLQSQVNSLSRSQSATQTATVTPSVATPTVTTTPSTGGSTGITTGTTTTTSNNNKATQNTPTTTNNTTTQKQDTEIAGTPVTTSGTQHELGYVEQIKKITQSQSLVKADGQKAVFSLSKLSDAGNIKLDLHGATYTDTTAEQKDNAYNIINYYLNNLEKLGDLGDVELKKIASNKDYNVDAEVVASVDVTPSGEMAKEIVEQGKTHLKISSDELDKNALYFIVHESTQRPDTFDVALQKMNSDGLNIELQDCSPVTITKISYGKISGNGGTTETMVSSTKTGTDNSMLKIIFIILAIVAVGGGAIGFIIYRKKRGGFRR